MKKEGCTVACRDCMFFSCPCKDSLKVLHMHVRLKGIPRLISCMMVKGVSLLPNR